MKTQSPDTSPEAERILIEGYRRMTPREKTQRVLEINRFGYQLALAGVRRRHPNADEREQKLLRYRMTGERSDRQWGDVQGILKVQGNALDFAYLRHWGAELELTDLLTQSFEDAGVDGTP